MSIWNDWQDFWSVETERSSRDTSENIRGGHDEYLEEQKLKLLNKYHKQEQVLRQRC